MIKNFFLVIFFIPFLLKAQISPTSFISGNDTVCDNSTSSAVVVFNFSGTSPFTFVYAINGINEPSITTSINPFLLSTKQAGIYTLETFSDFNGPGTVNGSALVTIHTSPIATIYTSTDTLSIMNPGVDLYSHSSGNIVQQVWNYGDNTGNDTTNNPYHIFPTDTNGIGLTNIYQVTLIIEDNNGCLDTTLRHLWINEEYWMYIPTSFTPDNDKINDKFCIEYYGIRENTFLFKIFNRQGDLVHQTTNPQDIKCSNHQGWDGYHKESNRLLLQGAYLYEVYFQDFEGWKHQEFGTITLIR